MKINFIFPNSKAGEYTGWLYWNTIGDQSKWMIRLWNSYPFEGSYKRDFFKAALGHSCLENTLMIINFKHYYSFDYIDVTI